MMIFTRDEQVPWEKVKDRDKRFRVSLEQKKEARKDIEHAKIHPDTDECWK